MNTYSRIRSIENSQEFKRLVDTVLGAEFGKEYQSVKEWHDFGIDGYHKKQKIVYAFYCPRYPERRELEQYRRKIADDIETLATATVSKKIKLGIKEWIFVTPDDLALEIIDFIHRECDKKGWHSGTITAQVLAPLFMKHSGVHVDFPIITAGLQFDKVPSVSVRMAKNREYQMLEVFNDGTEDLKDIEVSMSEDNGKIRILKNHFLYEFDNPMHVSPHSLFNLRKGERQYGNNVPVRGGFNFKVSGVGVESSKMFVKEGFIDKDGVQ